MSSLPPLKPLAPAVVEPQWHSPRAFVASNLRKIGSVKVAVDESSQSHSPAYALSVAPSEFGSTGIPTSTRSDHSPPVWMDEVHTAACFVGAPHRPASCAHPDSPSKPTSPVLSPTNWGESQSAKTKTTVKHLEDFDELRYKVYNFATALHAFEKCEFCEAALTCVLWGRGQHYQKQRDALTRVAQDEQKLLETMAAMTRDLVVLCSSAASRDRMTADPSTPLRAFCRMEDALPGHVYAFLFGSIDASP